MSSVPVSSALPPGAVFGGRYRVVRALKTGGMGTIYEAVDQNTAAPRALKVMLPSILGDADQRARFALEARVTGSIESDHLVRVSDSGIDEASGSPFLVMELLRGEDLGDLLARQGPLPPADVVTYLSQTALALDKTHAANIVHRDIKPDNLLLTRRDDGSPCIKILDFGIAKVVASNKGQKTRALGTPLYMAPEQIKGESAIGPRADLYSLAQVAYTILVGEPYWAEEATADESLYSLLMKVMTGADEPPSARAHRRNARGPSRLPPAFDAWFFRATAVAPEARFERATAEVAALAELLTAASSFAMAATAPPPPAPATGAWSQATPALAPPAPPAHAFATAAPGTAFLPAAPVAPFSPAAPAHPFAHAAPAPAFAHAAPAFAPASAHGFAPMAPVAPTAPAKKSRALPIALVVIGAVMAVGLVLIGVALLGGGDSGASLGLPGQVPGQVVPGCAMNATCITADVPDPAHVDAQALLPTVLKIAKGNDSRAMLSIINVMDIGTDGTSDISGDTKSVAYMFSIPGATLSVTLRKKLAVIMKTPPLPYSRNTPEPHCSQKAAYKAAIAGGLTGPGVSAMFASNDVSPGGVWTISATRQSYIVDGKTCVIKTSSRF